jgi:CelD/BcsL family acetyltransferase involved in cellulose biosynthesis
VTAETGPPGYRTIIARTEEELEGLRPAWDALQGDVLMTDPVHFLTILREDPKVRGPWVLLLERDEAPVAMVVGRIEHHEFTFRIGYRGVYKVRLPTLTVVYGGFLGPDAAAEGPRLLDAVLGALSRREADAVYLPNLRVDTPLFAAAMSRPSARGRQRSWSPKVHWRLALPGSLEEFIQSRPSKSRGRIRRYPKRLLEEFDGRYRIEIFRDVADLDRLVADVEEVAKLTYQRGLGIRFAEDRLMLSLTAKGMEEGWFRGYVLYVDEKPRAYWLGFGYRGVFRTGLTGYDPAFAEYNVGTFLLMRMIDDLARDDDFHVIDYGFGDAEYKHTFGTESWHEADVLVFAPTLRGSWRNLGRTSVQGVDRSMRSVGAPMIARVKKAWRRRLQSSESR